jgi:hypothetical protein
VCLVCVCVRAWNYAHTHTHTHSKHTNTHIHTHTPNTARGQNFCPPPHSAKKKSNNPTHPETRPRKFQKTNPGNCPVCSESKILAKICAGSLGRRYYEGEGSGRGKNQKARPWPCWLPIACLRLLLGLLACVVVSIAAEYNTGGGGRVCVRLCMHVWPPTHLVSHLSHVRVSLVRVLRVWRAVGVGVGACQVGG